VVYGRRRQDLVTEPPVTFPDGVQNIKLPVNGRQRALGKLLGNGATIVVNVKLDDPETITQVPAIRALVTKYADQGLHVICVATDQGDYEPDDSPTVRIKLAQQYGLASSSKVCVAKRACTRGRAAGRAVRQTGGARGVRAAD